VNSLILSIPYVGCHSVFSDDFKVYMDSIFDDDLWISTDIAFLTSPCVNHDSIVAIDLMCPSWIHWCCRFHTSPVTQFSVTISTSKTTRFADDLWISSDIVSLIIPCISDDSIFVIDLMCLSWIHLRNHFHTSGVTQFSMMISWSTATQLSLTIYGSIVTYRFW